jgi:hypothetical protein
VEGGRGKLPGGTGASAIVEKEAWRGWSWAGRGPCASWLGWLGCVEQAGVGCVGQYFAFLHE